MYIREHLTEDFVYFLLSPWVTDDELFLKGLLKAVFLTSCYVIQFPITLLMNGYMLMICYGSFFHQEEAEFKMIECHEAKQEAKTIIVLRKIVSRFESCLLFFTQLNLINQTTFISIQWHKVGKVLCITNANTPKYIC